MLSVHTRAFAHAHPLPGTLLTHLHLLNLHFLRETCLNCPLPHNTSQKLRTQPSHSLAALTSTALSHLYSYLGDGASPTGLGASEGRDRVCPGPHCVSSPTQHRARPKAFINSGWGWQNRTTAFEVRVLPSEGKTKKILHSFIHPTDMASRLSALPWSPARQQ